MPIAFLVFVCLVGGGARSDIASLPLLRGASVLFAFWAAFRMRAEDWKQVRVPLALLLLLSLWMALQLVPLPPAIWQSLPGRETIVAIDALLGQGDLWRPISLTPSQTLNSLLAMTVPIAALLLAARITVEDHSRLMFAIVWIGVAGALLGFFQILSGMGGAAYLYRITNDGMMVGLFANRNHHTFFMALALIVAATLLRDELMRRQQRTMVTVGLALSIILFATMAALVGSRAGFAAGVLAFCVGYAMVGLAWKNTSAERPASASRRDRSPSPALRRWKDAILYAPPVMLVAMLGVVLWLSNRYTAATRLTDRAIADDLRVQTWPTVQNMIETYWVTGGGFGSFPDIYKMYEPDILLQPSYFNHAHNDWVELLITGGVPFAVITLVGLIWIGRLFAAKGMRNLMRGYRGDTRLTLLVVSAILALTSLVDYPLRVPSLQVVAILLIMTLASRSVSPSEQSGSPLRGDNSDLRAGSKRL